MRKNVLFVALSSLFLLASCGTFSGGTGSANSSVPLSVIEQNLFADYSGNLDNPDYSTHVFNYTFSDSDTYSIYSSSHRSYGLLLLEENSTGNVGFYSLVHNKFLINPFPYNGGSRTIQTLTSYSEAPINFVYGIGYNDQYVIIDSAGNVLYDDVAPDSWRVYNTHTLTIEGSDGSSATYFVMEVRVYHSSRNDDYESINKIYYTTIASDYNAAEIIDSTAYGSYTDLAPLGHPGYYLTYNVSSGQYITVDIYSGSETSKTLSTSYVIPLKGESNTLYFIGDKLVTKSLFAVPEDSSDYTLYTSGVKTKLYYDAYDIMNGNHTALNANIYIAGSYATYKDAEGIVKYIYTYGHYIQDKLMGDYFEGIIDSSLNLVYNVTGQATTDFIRLRNGNLFNMSTHHIYDEKMENLVASLSAYDGVDYSQYARCFVVTSSGGYGLYDEDGKEMVALSASNSVTWLNEERSSFYFQQGLNDGTYDVFYYGIGENDGYRIASYDPSIGESFSSVNARVYRASSVYDEDLNVYTYNFYDNRGNSIFSYRNDDTPSLSHYNCSSTLSKLSYSMMYYTQGSTSYYTVATYAGYSEFPSYAFDVTGSGSTDDPSGDSTFTSLDFDGYTVINDTSYPWLYDGSARFTSNNHDHSTSSTLTVRFEEAGIFVFVYDISSESGYDKISVSKEGIEMNLSNTSGKFTGNSVIVSDVSMGEMLEITYTKDESQSSYDDCVTVYGMTFTPSNSTSWL